MAHYITCSGSPWTKSRRQGTRLISGDFGEGSVFEVIKIVDRIQLLAEVKPTSHLFYDGQSCVFLTIFKATDIPSQVDNDIFRALTAH